MTKDLSRTTTLPSILLTNKQLANEVYSWYQVVYNHHLWLLLLQLSYKIFWCICVVLFFDGYFFLVNPFRLCPIFRWAAFFFVFHPFRLFVQFFDGWLLYMFDAFRPCCTYSSMAEFFLAIDFDFSVRVMSVAHRYCSSGRPAKQGGWWVNLYQYIAESSRPNTLTCVLLQGSTTGLMEFRATTAPPSPRWTAAACRRATRSPTSTYSSRPTSATGAILCEWFRTSCVHRRVARPFCALLVAEKKQLGNSLEHVCCLVPGMSYGLSYKLCAHMINRCFYVLARRCKVFRFAGKIN